MHTTTFRNLKASYGGKIASILFQSQCLHSYLRVPDSKVHGANMGPTWVLSAPDGPHVSPMNLSITVYSYLRVPTLASHTRRCHVDGSYVTGSRHVLLALCQGKDSWHISPNIIPPVPRSIWQNIETFSKVFTSKFYDALSTTTGNAMDFHFIDIKRNDKNTYTYMYA